MLQDIQVRTRDLEMTSDKAQMSSPGYKESTCKSENILC